MFLHRLGSTDSRFNPVEFHEGLNLLIADRTVDSQQGDSRNGTGKSSFVRILRYVLGGGLPDELKVSALTDHVFNATFNLPSIDRTTSERVTVARPVTPTTRVTISPWSAAGTKTDLSVEEWKALLASHVFRRAEDTARPTTSQLWGQLVRTSFGRPTKIHSTETDWETGVRLGYFLGLAPEVLGKAGEVAKLEKQRTAIRSAIREGAISHLALDEAELRSQVAAARRKRDRTKENLANYRVDEQYGDHQITADRLTGQIQTLNDEILSLERRSREITQVLDAEVEDVQDPDMQKKLSRVYAEIGVVLPESVSRRFEEVTAFHASVIRNRKNFLQDEHQAVLQRLTELSLERKTYDENRSDVLRLLEESIALDAFLDAQRSLSTQDAEVADLERRLENAGSLAKLDTTLKSRTAETVASVRTEIEERSTNLEGPISLFNELGAEIYTDRSAQLLISPTPKGILKVDPQVDGDASDGIRGVETFLLDLVCLISGLSNDRTPGLLVHDSHLFDAIDHRQVASCLNIAARLAEQHGFQYIVTMNSDFLASVEQNSDGISGQKEMVFDRTPYLTELQLTDATDESGLFGFSFT